ncbi:NUDIX hydrolase [Salinicoccus roseus]|uniref:NUDIX hydrolase n=1 Tax=Salinicoccus roseus TaxID=45670 RepID=UPI0035689397
MFPTHILATGAYVRNSNDEILLVKTYNRSWQIPGGQVENGEDLVEAVIREVKEESGIDISVNTIVGMYSNTGTYAWDDGKISVPTKLMVDFDCLAIGEEIRTSEETSEVKWVDASYINNFIESLSLRKR